MFNNNIYFEESTNGRGIHAFIKIEFPTKTSAVKIGELFSSFQKYVSTKIKESKEGFDIKGVEIRGNPSCVSNCNGWFKIKRSGCIKMPRLSNMELVEQFSSSSWFTIEYFRNLLNERCFDEMLNGCDNNDFIPISTSNTSIDSIIRGCGEQKNNTTTNDGLEDIKNEPDTFKRKIKYIRHYDKNDGEMSVGSFTDSYYETVGNSRCKHGEATCKSVFEGYVPSDGKFSPMRSAVEENNTEFTDSFTKEIESQIHKRKRISVENVKKYILSFRMLEDNETKVAEFGFTNCSAMLKNKFNTSLSKDKFLMIERFLKNKYFLTIIDNTYSYESGKQKKCKGKKLDMPFNEVYKIDP